MGIPSQWFAPTAEPQTARWQGSAEDATRNLSEQFSDEEQGSRRQAYAVIDDRYLVCLPRLLPLFKYGDYA